MSNVIKLLPKQSSVQDTIDIMNCSEFDDIIIIGIKDYEIKIGWSNLEDHFKIAGLLEQAKLDILHD